MIVLLVISQQADTVRRAGVPAATAETQRSVRVATVMCPASTDQAPNTSLQAEALLSHVPES